MLFHEYGILLKNPFLYCSPVMKFMLLNMTLKIIQLFRPCFSTTPNQVVLYYSVLTV